MRNQPFIVASIAALLLFGASTSAQPQEQSQPVPDAPQPQKKPAAKPPTPDKTDSKDDNAFPEAVSKAAAKQAAGTSDSDPAQPGNAKPATKDDNPFPEAVSKAAAKADSDPSQPGDAKPATKDDNPFPEAVSKAAAKEAGNDSAPDTKRDIPPGVSSSSSQSSGTEEDEPGKPPTVADPARAKKDADVAGFYLKTGNYQGALLRYKDATASDPTNVEAIFGLAEAQRMLKKNAEAARNYQLYLDIEPNGPKAKQALKALKTLPPTG
jgi:tetratricopeptide (TPR) repeat protein